MHSNKHMFICTILLLAGCQSFTGAVQCIGQDGSAVDWWIVLKYPLGYRSTYLDSNSIKSCNDTNCWSKTFDVRYDNAVVSTVKQIEQEGTGWFFYNDEDPTTGDEKWTNAHAKGAVVFDNTSGLWLVHSAPKYPARIEDPNWWILRPAQSKYGQHFACVSLTSNSTDSLGRLLNLEKVYMYDQSDLSNLSTDLQSQYPNLAQLLLTGSGTIRKPTSQSELVQTFNGLQLLAFGKAPTPRAPFHIHEEFIEATYNTPMFWETWRPGGEPTFCPLNGYPSYNNIRISIPETGAYWNTTNDHSKWGVSVDSNTPVACFGDLNRAESQAKRGGGYVCWTDATLWNAVRKLVVKYEDCAASPASSGTTVQ